MSDYVKTAIGFIQLIIGNEPTAEGIYELFEINNGNKKVILEHLKAINSIVSKAIEELEGENVSTSKTKV